MDDAAPIRKSPSCEIGVTGDYLRAIVGPGLAHDIQECYRALINECLGRQFKKVLVIGRSRYDAFLHLALRDALSSIALAGVPVDFKLALVAEGASMIAIYDAVAVEAQRRGINARRLPDEAQAARWLASTT